MPAFRFRYADEPDAPVIADLVESGYRGERSRAGWTTEADLLDGQRIDVAGVLAVIRDPASRVLLAERQTQLEQEVREMRQELVHVLDRSHGEHGARGLRRGGLEAGPSVQDVLEMFDRLAVQVTVWPVGPTPRCTDGADQKFIDLALSRRAHWLLSRDRAVLKLRRKLQAITGCRVQRPEDWPGQCAGEPQG